MQTVVSGIRSTGNLHIGNYFGAINNFLKMQEEYNCYFFIADYHSLTTHPDPIELRKSVRDVVVEYLASGLNPEKCTLYIQSHLPETAELYLLLNMHAYLGELERAATFKDKIRKQPDNVNAGLLTYPVLMAADILIHNAHLVPVGKDQVQHLEMTRKYAGRFNHMYGEEFFNLPQVYHAGGDPIKVPGLDGSMKMGKSEGNAIYLRDENDAIHKKIMRAVSDGGPTEKNQKKPDAIENLFSIMKLVSTDEVYQQFNQDYNSCNIRYGDMKKKLSEDMQNFIHPIREEIKKVSKDNALIDKVIRKGEDKARASASQVLNKVRTLMGVGK